MKFSKASGALPQTPLGGLQRPQTPSWRRAVLRTACLASQDLPSSFFSHSSYFGRTSFFFVATALFMSSLCQTRLSLCPFFIHPTDHIRKSRPGACLRRKRYRQARATTETALERCERSTKEPIATNPSIAKDS